MHQKKKEEVNTPINKGFQMHQPYPTFILNES